MSDRHARRRDALRKRLRDPKGTPDALLVTSEPNVTYLTGFTGDSSALILGRRKTLIVSDGRYAEQIEHECPGLESHIRPVGQAMLAALTEVIGRLGPKNVGFEAAHLSVAEYEKLREALPSVSWKALVGQVEALRAIKDREEIELIREAIGQAERTFAMVRAGLRGDDSEKDVADAIEAYLRRCGAESASFSPIVAAGAGAALPHYQPSAGVRIGQADFVLIDWGASHQGFKSDLTRVLVTGKVTPRFKKVYRAVLAAQERAIAAIRPGVAAREVDAEARAALDDAGFGRFFTHGLGHGLGLQIHEAPSLRRESNDTLQAGMVVTIEPGVYLPGWGGIRIEDDVLVTPDGPEILTHVPRSLDAVTER